METQDSKGLEAQAAIAAEHNAYGGTSGHGTINTDAELFVGVESDVISRANGCICCTIRDDLIATVMKTINRSERPEERSMMTLYVQGSNSVLARPELIPTLLRRITEGVC